MEYLIFAGLIALGVFEYKNKQQLNKIQAELKMFRSRQSEIRMQQTSVKKPVIDARARTTTRDTNDLPATARIGRVTRRRVWVGGDTNDS